jgi:hypothetical protein
MQDVLDFTFSAEIEAKYALEKANERWERENIEESWQHVLVDGKIEIVPRPEKLIPPKGEVMRINLNGGQQEPDPDGPFWMVVSDDGEYAVSRAGDWVCVV